MTIVTNQIDIDKINACQRFFENDPIKNATLKNDNASKIEKTIRAINVSVCIGSPNIVISAPDKPKLKNIIVIKIIANPNHLPNKKDCELSGYVANKPQCPSSFSDVMEKLPNNNVISGSKYKVIFIIVPVISVYPSTDATLVCSNKIAPVKIVNKIKKEYVQELRNPNFNSRFNTVIIRNVDSTPSFNVCVCRFFSKTCLYRNYVKRVSLLKSGENTFFPARIIYVHFNSNIVQLVMLVMFIVLVVIVIHHFFVHFPFVLV